MKTLSQHIEGLIKPHYPNAKVYDAHVAFNMNEGLGQLGRMTLEISYSVIGYDSFDPNLLTIGRMLVYRTDTRRVDVPQFKYAHTFITDVRCHMLYGKETEELVQHLADMFKVKR